VRLKISLEGEILDYHCTCDYQRGYTPCGHVIYVLLLLQDMEHEEVERLAQKEAYYQELLEERQNQYLLRNTQLFTSSQLQQATQIWKHIVSPREYQVYANVEGMFPTYTITCKVGYDRCM